MLFHAHKTALDFTLGGRRYVVPQGGEVDIPDHIAFCVATRGLHLTKGPSPSGGKRVEPQDPPHAAVHVAALAVPEKEAEEELADVTGEDPQHERGPDPTQGELTERADGKAQQADEADDEAESDVAERTFQQLSDQGIHVPGKRPHKRHRS